MLREVLNKRPVRAGATRVAQAGDERLQAAGAGIGADGGDEVRPHETRTGPGAIAHPVEAPADGLQAVVAHLQAQQRQVPGDGL